MRAATIDRYGPPEVLQITEREIPVPGDHDVLIRIHAAVATPSDCAFRSADPFIVRFFAGLTKPKFATPGDALAGEVVAAGRMVTRFKPGDRVHGCSDASFGACADYIAMPETRPLVPVPAGVSYAEAVAAGEAFLTAMPFLRDEAKLKPGQSILINGASGSVGSSAVQIARHMGAVVTGVNSTRNLAMVHELGADRVIDYTRDDFTAEPGAWDVIFDAVGKSSFTRCRRALKPGGIYMTTVPSAGIAWHMLTTRAPRTRGLLATTGLRPADAKTKDLLLLNRMLAEGTVRPVIDRAYPLEAIAEAHRYVETGRKRGSVVIAIVDEERRRLAA